MDQNSAFDLEVKENCPNGVVVYNLFHVLSNFGRKVIDRVRVDAANSLRHAPWLRKVVKSSRYLLYKRPENLSEKEHTKLAELSKLNTPLLKCYLMGDELRHLWSLGTRGQAIALVMDWIHRATHSRIKPLVDFGKNLRGYVQGIIAAADLRSTPLYLKVSTIKSSKLSDELMASETICTLALFNHLGDPERTFC